MKNWPKRQKKRAKRVRSQRYIYLLFQIWPRMKLKNKIDTRLSYIKSKWVRNENGLVMLTTLMVRMARYSKRQLESTTKKRKIKDKKNLRI